MKMRKPLHRYAFLLFYILSYSNIAWSEQHTFQGLQRQSDIRSETSDSASWNMFSKYFPTNDPASLAGSTCPSGMCFGIAWHVRLLNDPSKVSYAPNATPETVFSLRQKIELAARGEQVTLNGVANAGDVAKHYPTTIKGSIEETQARLNRDILQIAPIYRAEHKVPETSASDRNKALVERLDATLMADGKASAPLFYIFPSRGDGHVMNVNHIQRNPDGSYTVKAQDRNFSGSKSEGSNLYTYKISKEGIIRAVGNAPQLSGRIQSGYLDTQIPGEPTKVDPGWAELRELKTQTKTTAFPETEGPRESAQNPLLKISPVYGNSGSNTAVRDLVDHFAKDLKVSPQNVWFDRQTGNYRLRTNEGKVFSVVPQDIVRHTKDAQGQTSYNWTAGLQLQPDQKTGNKAESFYVEYGIQDGKLTQNRETFRINAQGEIEPFATHKTLQDAKLTPRQPASENASNLKPAVPSPIPPKVHIRGNDGSAYTDTSSGSYFSGNK